MKHAYLILAHNEFGLLQKLIDCLDDVRNSIYVHIDKKAGTMPRMHTAKAVLKLLEERVDIRWGDLSMIKAEYALLEAAAADGPFAYYHLLSGVDLPLKSQDYIHRFFEQHAGKEFIGYSEITPEELSRRMQYWHIFPRHFSRKRNGYSALRSACLQAQKVLGVRRNKGVEFKKGSQWASVTEDFVQYLLEKKAFALRNFSHTFVPDECLMQTMAWNSPFRERLFSLASDGEGCMRAIGWKQCADGTWELSDWKNADYEALKASPALFARKFGSGDPVFIEKILRFARNDDAAQNKDAD